MSLKNNRFFFRLHEQFEINFFLYLIFCILNFKFSFLIKQLKKL